MWGLLDGRADARANPDPDRRADLAMMWLLAGLVAGVVSGAVAWLVSLLYRGLYVGALINEITTFAAFTALLVFLPGMGAVALGRYLIDRKEAYARGIPTGTKTGPTPTCSTPCGVIRTPSIQAVVESGTRAGLRRPMGGARRSGPRRWRQPRGATGSGRDPERPDRAF